MAGRIPCTCGCGLEVTYTTKQNHLNALGKTSLRARVVTEAELLKRNTRQQQKPTPFLQRGFKKRASSIPDQDDSRKRRKAAQLEPEITQVDTDLIEDLLPQVAADTDRQSRFVERSRGVMEMRWTTSRRDSGSHSDGKDGDNDGGDDDEEDKDRDKDEEDKDEDGEDKDEDGEDKDEDGEDKDGDGEDKDGDEDEDEDEPPFYDSEIPGISNWDLLGEGFEREAAALGLFSS